MSITKSILSGLTTGLTTGVIATSEAPNTITDITNLIDYIDGASSVTFSAGTTVSEIDSLEVSGVQRTFSNINTVTYDSTAFDGLGGFECATNTSRMSSDQGFAAEEQNFIGVVVDVPASIAAYGTVMSLGTNDTPANQAELGIDVTGRLFYGRDEGLNYIDLGGDYRGGRHIFMLNYRSYDAVDIYADSSTILATIDPRGSYEAQNDIFFGGLADSVIGTFFAKAEDRQSDDPTFAQIVDYAIDKYNLNPDLDSFITTWQTTSASESITLPFTDDGSYSALVNWGDGNLSTITAYNDADRIHTYADAGTYSVRITGTVGGWSFNNTGDKGKIRTIEQWGSNVWANLTGGFYGCSGLVSNTLDAIDLSGVTTLESMFQNATFSGEINSWDTSTITAAPNLFRSATFNSNIGSWDVSNITDMRTMFFNSTFNQDLSNWDVSSVDNMGSMFRGCPFDQDIGSWDVSNVTNMGNMFLSSTLSTTNYDSLLTGWGALTLRSSINFHGGSSTYSAGAPATARANIISIYSWTITDGGQV